jgi:hypothetical protein
VALLEALPAQRAVWPVPCIPVAVDLTDVKSGLLLLVAVVVVQVALPKLPEAQSVIWAASLTALRFLLKVSFVRLLALLLEVPQPLHLGVEEFEH